MNERQIKTGPSFWISIVLILLGVYLLLENFGFIYLDIWDFWPLILVAIGLVKLIGSNFKDVYSSVILIVVGFLLFLIKMNYIEFYQVRQFWPLILVLIGAKIIWNHFVRENNPGYRKDTYSQDRLDAVAIFGGREVKVNSDRFEGGNITSIFGGAEVDFSNSRLAPGENILDVFVMFGGAELHVPRDWNVVLNGLPIFGGFADERKAYPPADIPAENTLIIKGMALFGGLSIKNTV